MIGGEGRPSLLSLAQRVEVWDAAFAAVRTCLRGGGLREVSTPVRVPHVAIEPWIEPLPSAGQWLATSPELPMKELLARGSGSIFQIAHVLRRAERGARHREEFHLIEWYRVGDAQQAFAEIRADVEAVVAAVFEAVGTVLDHEVLAPRRWERVNLLALMSEQLGATLAGDEDAEALAPLLERVRADSGLGLDAGDVQAPADGELAQLLAWTELFSLWSDLHLDPWLCARAKGGEGREGGGDEDGGVAVHVGGFPYSLAALAEHEPDGKIAARFESHVGGVELANGYRELRAAGEQRRRFERVAAMRRHYGQPPLPMPERFLACVDELPPCAGVALGLDRLVALSCGRERLDEVALVEP